MFVDHFLGVFGLGRGRGLDPVRRPRALKGLLVHGRRLLELKTRSQLVSRCQMHHLVLISVHLVHLSLSEEMSSRVHFFLSCLLVRFAIGFLHRRCLIVYVLLPLGYMQVINIVELRYCSTVLFNANFVYENAAEVHI